ncbi:hypothetical protein ACIBW9_33035, partial [Streptomyces sp. NPDC049541]
GSGTTWSRTHCVSSCCGHRTAEPVTCGAVWAGGADCSLRPGRRKAAASAGRPSPLTAAEVGGLTGGWGRGQWYDLEPDALRVFVLRAPDG